MVWSLQSPKKLSLAQYSRIILCQFFMSLNISRFNKLTRNITRPGARQASCLATGGGGGGGDWSVSADSRLMYAELSFVRRPAQIPPCVAGTGLDSGWKLGGINFNYRSSFTVFFCFQIKIFQTTEQRWAASTKVFHTNRTRRSCTKFF